MKNNFGLVFVIGVLLVGASLTMYFILERRIADLENQNRELRQAQANVTPTVAPEETPSSADYEVRVRELYESAMNKKMIQKDLDGAEQDFEQIKTAVDEAGNNNVANTEILIYRSMAYEESGKYEDSITDCDSIIEADPEHARAFYHRAFAKYQLKRYAEAVEDANMAATLDSTYGEAFYLRGISLFKLNDYDAAVDAYDNALICNPQDPDSFYSRGLAKFMRGDIANSREDLKLALELRPDADTFQALAMVGLVLNEIPAASENARRAVELAPDDLHKSLALHCLQIATKKADAPAKSFETQYSGSDPWLIALRNFFSNKLTLEKLIEAAKDEELSPLYNVEDQLCEAYFYIGFLRLANGEKDESRRWFEQCVDTNTPDFPEYAVAKAFLKKAPSPTPSAEKNVGAAKTEAKVEKVLTTTVTKTPVSGENK